MTGSKTLLLMVRKAAPEQGAGLFCWGGGLAFKGGNGKFVWEKRVSRNNAVI